MRELLQRMALAILKQPDWHDFGPTFAAEQWAKRHQIQVGKETLRGWMSEAGMGTGKSQGPVEVHGWRPRRSGFGELVQWDTSEHDWLEGRGPVRYLVRMIDEATSGSGGRFVESDATPQNMGAVGIPGKERPHGGCVHGSRFSVRRAAPAGREPGATACGGPADATGESFAGVRDRFHSGVLASGQGADRAQLLDRSGSSGKASCDGQRSQP